MERPTFYQKMLANKSADEETSEVLGPGIVSRVREVTLYVTTIGAVTSGQVLLETAPDPAFTGTWAIVATVNPNATDAVFRSSATGVWLALRVRINTVIGGGAIDAVLVGN